MLYQDNSTKVNKKHKNRALAFPFENSTMWV